MDEAPRTLRPNALPSMSISDISQPSCSMESKETEMEENLEDDTKPHQPTTDSTEPTKLPTATQDCQEQSKETSADAVNIPAKKYKDITKIKQKYQAIFKKFKMIFTPGQVRYLHKSNKRRVKWSPDDVATAITFKRICPEGYHYMRDVVGIPLPGFSTLCRWVTKFRH